MTGNGNQGHQIVSMYNDGNDEIATMNRFSFPAISFSPSFPPTTPSTLSPAVKGLLSPKSPISAGGSGVLSPRSPHHRNTAGGTSPPQNGQLYGSVSSSAFACSTNGSLKVPSTPSSPLPPLSPRGQKLADSEKYHQAKCLNRIVEKRRKASDGTCDIIMLE